MPSSVLIQSTLWTWSINILGLHQLNISKFFWLVSKTSSMGSLIGSLEEMQHLNINYLTQGGDQGLIFWEIPSTTTCWLLVMTIDKIFWLWGKPQSHLTSYGKTWDWLRPILLSLGFSYLLLGYSLSSFYHHQQWCLPDCKKWTQLNSYPLIGLITSDGLVLTCISQCHHFLFFASTWWS